MIGENMRSCERLVCFVLRNTSHYNVYKVTEPEMYIQLVVTSLVNIDHQHAYILVFQCEV